MAGSDFERNDGVPIPVDLTGIEQNASKLLEAAISSAVANALSKAKNIIKNGNQPLTDALKNAEKKLENTTNNLNKNNEKNNKKLEKSIKDLTSALDKETRYRNSLESKSKSKDPFSILETFGKNFAQLRRGLETIGKVFSNVATPLIENSQKRLNWLIDLENAGYRLAGGFDNSFHRLSQVAGMTHDNFANLLLSNTKEFTRLNSMGKNQIDRMMAASGNLIGKFGYNAESASNVMMHYMKTVALTGSEEELRTRNITLETERLAKELKALSVATGKSVEQLIKEREERENTLFFNRIERDPKLKAFYQTLSEAGQPDDVIKALITKVHNEGSSLFTSTDFGRYSFNRLSGAYDSFMNGSIDESGLIKIMADIQKSPKLRNELARIDKMDMATVAALSKTTYGQNALNSILNIAKHKFDDKATVGEGNVDEESVNKATKNKAALNRLYNQHTENLTMSTQNFANALDMLTSKIDSLREALSGPWGTAMSATTAALSNGVGSGFGWWLAGKGIKYSSALKQGGRTWSNALRGAKGAMKGTALLSAGFNALDAYNEISAANELRDKGMISENQYKDRRNKSIVGAVGGTGGSVGGAAIGAAIGSFILPGIGTMLGAAIGGMAGNHFGKKAGEAVGDMFVESEDDIENAQQNTEEMYNVSLERNDRMVSIMNEIEQNTRNTMNTLTAHLTELKLNGLEKNSTLA